MGVYKEGKNWKVPLSVGSEQDDPVRCQGPMLALVC